jgi:hypothetical protein
MASNAQVVSKKLVTGSVNPYNGQQDREKLKKIIFL